MARSAARQVNSRYVSGNLAQDYDYLERERERQAARERREYAERERRERAPRAATRARAAALPKTRERIRVSGALVVAFLTAAALALVLLMSYAQLAALSNSVVRQQRTLAALQDEHVRLTARYEKTFDLTAVKEAAERAGMAKPSASQIYYIDLSAPDNVVLYPREETNAIERAAVTVGQGVAAIVEYFK